MLWWLWCSWHANGAPVIWWWRRVRKANIDADLRRTFERYGVGTMQAILAAAGRFRHKGSLENVSMHESALLDWLTECSDTQERREQRSETIEIGVVALITIEIALSLYFGIFGITEGDKQAAILDQMNRNTAATASQIQKAADAMAATLQVLREDQAERAKKPRATLYVGNIPIDKATIHPTVPNRLNESMATARLDLRLTNEGDAPLSAAEIHVLVPEGTNFFFSTLPPVPEYEEPSKPATRTMSYAVPLTPVGKNLRIKGEVSVPKGQAPFKMTFTLTTPQLPAVSPLGQLTVIPPKP